MNMVIFLFNAMPIYHMSALWCLQWWILKAPSSKWLQTSSQVILCFKATGISWMSRRYQLTNGSCHPAHPAKVSCVVSVPWWFPALCHDRLPLHVCHTHCCTHVAHWTTHQHTALTIPVDMAALQHYLDNNRRHASCVGILTFKLFSLA